MMVTSRPFADARPVMPPASVVVANIKNYGDKPRLGRCPSGDAARFRRRRVTSVGRLQLRFVVLRQLGRLQLRFVVLRQLGRLQLRFVVLRQLAAYNCDSPCRRFPCFVVAQT